ncbi:retrovirus-related pol polyprotein from transposon TNT 1-94 [Tanacetum coccineum]
MKELKEELTIVRIKNDSVRDENVSIKKRYQDLYQSKAESNSNVSSEAAVPEKPKVFAPGLYAMTPKYIPPQKRNNREANTHLPRKEIVSLIKKTNLSVNLSTGIKSVTKASKSKSKYETKTHRNLPARSENVKIVDNPLRNLNKRNRVDSSLSIKHTGFISQSVSVCKTCNECLVFGNHNKCGVKNLNSVNAKNPKVKNNATMKQVWKATSKIFASIGSKWKPTERKFTLGDTCPLTRITKPEVVPLEKSRSISTSEPDNNVIVTPRFSKKPLTSYKHKDRKLKDISIGSPPNTETKAVNDPVNVNDLSANQLDPNKNWVFDVLNSTASLVFQCRFADYKSILYLTKRFDGSISSLLALKSLFNEVMVMASLVNHLNFGTLNELARKDLVRGLPKLKYEKEHLCLSCQLGKRPMRVKSINRKKYILVIVNDYTKFGWVRFLRTKDETPEVIKKFIILTQRALNATVRYLRTDNGTEFVNKTLTEFCKSVGITHNTSVPQNPQQNGVVERRNRTLIKAACTMLIFAKAPMFLWAEAMATACYTLNRSLIHTLHRKIYYELLKGKKPEVKYFWVFGSLCYPTNDYDDLGKLKAKADIGILLAMHLPRRRTESTTREPVKSKRLFMSRLGPNSMAHGQNGAGPEINNLQSGQIGSGLITTPTTPSVPPTKKQLSELFQPLFDEDEEFPPEVHPHLVNVAPPRAPEIAHDSHSSTTVTKDAPATTTITSPSQTYPPDTSVNGPEHTFTASSSESFENSITNEFDSEASSFGTVNVNPNQQNNPPIIHEQKWTKDHPLENVIRDLN